MSRNVWACRASTSKVTVTYNLSAHTAVKAPGRKARQTFLILEFQLENVTALKKCYA